MARGDYDVDKRTRSTKDADGIPETLGKSLLAVPVLYDTVKNTVLSKDKKLVEEMKKSLKNFPDSVFENQVEGIDVVTSIAPKFSSNNPDTAAALGVLLDLADPVALGMGAVSKGKLLLGTNALRKAADKASDKAAANHLKSLAKKKGMHKQPLMEEIVKRYDLRDKLNDPEALMKKIQGEFEAVTKGSGPTAVSTTVKTKKGSLDETGEQIKAIVSQADKLGASKVDRTEIRDKILNAAKYTNKDLQSGRVVDVGELGGRLDRTLKPTVTKKKQVDIPPTSPKPLVPDETKTRLNKLSEEYKERSNWEKSQKLHKDEVAKADSAVKSAAKESESEASRILREQAKERQAAESSVGKSRSAIEQARQKDLAELENLRRQREFAFEELEPMDTIPNPRQVRGAPAYPAKEVLDIQLNNKRAAEVNRKYLEQDSVIRNLPDIDSRIAELEKRVSNVNLPEIDVPPPMPRDAIPTRVPEIAIPPAIPQTSGASRTLDEILAEIANTRKEGANLQKTNTKILSENARAAKQPLSVIEEYDEPVMSGLSDMWSLKQSLQEQVSDPQWQKAWMDNPEKAQQTRNLIKEIDTKISESLKEINLPEGNAADIYAGLNNDYSLQAQFLDLVKTDVMKEWKQPLTGMNDLAPAMLGGGTTVLASTAMGAGIPASTALGYASGRVAQKASKTFSSHAAMAKMLDRLSGPKTAYGLTSGGQEFVESGTEALGLVPPKEEEGEIPDIGNATINFEKSDPIFRRQQQGRSPNAVVEVPEAEEAMNIMGPEDFTPEEMWGPPPVNINEELLNTPLPRDSKRLLENPNVLVEKARQANPQAASIVEDMLQNDREGLIQNGGKVAAMFPTLFERDDYNSFDGIIADPEAQQKFYTDLSADRSMSSIEKAKLGNKVYRKQSIY